MLTIKRKAGQKIIIDHAGEQIEVLVVKSCVLCFKAGKDFVIRRDENCELQDNGRYKFEAKKLSE